MCEPSLKKNSLSGLMTPGHKSIVSVLRDTLRNTSDTSIRRSGSKRIPGLSRITTSPRTGSVKIWLLMIREIASCTENWK